MAGHPLGGSPNTGHRHSFPLPIVSGLVLSRGDVYFPWKYE
jgi:hypothetical protein